MTWCTFSTNGTMGRHANPKPGEKNGFEWSEENEELLIQLWEKHEFLYNLEMKDYCNIRKKRETYEKIAETLGATVDEVKRRITSMRTYLTHIKNKLAKAKNGGDAPKLTKRELFFQSRLQFLKEHLRERRNYAYSVKDDSSEEEEGTDDTGTCDGEMTFKIKEEPPDDADDSSTLHTGPGYQTSEDMDTDQTMFTMGEEQQVYVDVKEEPSTSVQENITTDNATPATPEATTSKGAWGGKSNCKVMKSISFPIPPQESESDVDTFELPKRPRKSNLQANHKPPVEKRTKTTNSTNSNNTAASVDSTFVLADDATERRLEMLSNLSSVISKSLSEECDEIATWGKLMTFKVRKLPEGELRNDLMISLQQQVNKALAGKWSKEES